MKKIARVFRVLAFAVHDDWLTFGNEAGATRQIPGFLQPLAAPNGVGLPKLSKP